MQLKRLTLSFTALCACTYLSEAQVVYSQWSSPAPHVTVVRSPSSALCSPLTCPVISNPGNTTDMDLSNYSTATFPALGLNSWVQYTMDLSSTVTNGYPGGVRFRSVTQLASLTVFPIYTLELLYNGIPVRAETYAGLIDLDLFTASGVNLCIVPVSPQLTYNQVRLTITRPVSVAIPLEFQVFYAYGNSVDRCYNGVLPETISNFSLKKINRASVELTWMLKDGSGLSHFVVQKNTNGVWIDLAQIPASDNGGLQQEYHYNDIDGTSGERNYRIVVYNKDGRKHIGMMKRVTIENSGNEIRLYPLVPYRNYRIELPDSMTDAKVFVINAQGLLQRVNVSGRGNTKDIDVSGLPAGAYWVKVVKDGKVQNRHILAMP